MITFGQGDRVLVEDGADLWTGEVLAPAGMIARDELRPLPLYVVALDDGRALLACQHDLWPEHPCPIPDVPPEPDGCHEWVRP
jgi:hypothetical protein